LGILVRNNWEIFGVVAAWNKFEDRFEEIGWVEQKQETRSFVGCCMEWCILVERRDIGPVG
jgi:hypothetical protein